MKTPKVISVDSDIQLIIKGTFEEAANAMKAHGMSKPTQVHLLETLNPHECRALVTREHLELVVKWYTEDDGVRKSLDVPYPPGTLLFYTWRDE